MTNKHPTEDLISRQDLLFIWDNLSTRGRTEFDQVIMTQPTAYDVDEVIDQLKCDDCKRCELFNDCSGNFYPTFMEKVIEIIRKGGIDE